MYSLSVVIQKITVDLMWKTLDDALMAYKDRKHIQRSIYILKLEGEHWYVGSSGNVDAAITRCKIGSGPKWTIEHPYKSTHETIPIEPTYDCDVQKNKIVIQLMLEHGVSKVRGGSYSTPEIPEWVEDQLYEQLNKHIDNNKMIKW